jgi:hypothetical protein
MALTPTYSWPLPDDTDLVKDGAEAIRDLGNAIDTTVSSTTGLVHIKETTFSAVSGADLDDVFSSDYKLYRVIVNSAPSTTANLLLRFRSVSGTSNVANYFYNIYRNTTTATTIVTASNQTGILVSSDDSQNFVVFDLYNIQASAQKAGIGMARKGTGRTFETVLYGTTETTVFTGLNLSVSTGTMTGSIQVFGYKD